MDASASEGRARTGSKLRPRFGPAVLVAVGCAAADVLSSFLLGTLGNSREANPFIASLVEHSPWWFFALFFVFLAPMPFLPAPARQAAAAAGITGNGACAVNNVILLLFGVAPVVGNLPFWTLIALPVVVALGTFAWLARRGGPGMRSWRACSWLAAYGLYVALLALACQALGEALK